MLVNVCNGVALVEMLSIALDSMVPYANAEEPQSRRAVLSESSDMHVAPGCTSIHLHIHNTDVKAVVSTETRIVDTHCLSERRDGRAAGGVHLELQDEISNTIYAVTDEQLMFSTPELKLAHPGTGQLQCGTREASAVCKRGSQSAQASRGSQQVGAHDSMRSSVSLH